MTRLNLGCGPIKKEGYLGLDKVEMPSVDIVHDLDIFPYPFNNNEIDEIYCSHILEHLSDFNKVMEELYRISKPDAIIRIRGPYYKSHFAFGDSTHKHFFTENSFNYFNDSHPLSFYSNARFKVMKIELITHGKKRLFPLKKILNHFLWNIYEEIYFELLVVKNMSIPRGDKNIVGERNDVFKSENKREKFEHINRYKIALNTIKRIGNYHRVLDAGCGTGYGARMLQNSNNEVFGIDISKKAIDYANNIYPGPTYICSNIEKMPFEDKFFDVITAFESIEHLENAEIGIKEIYRVLKNNGDLFISTPNPKNLENWIKNRIFNIPYPKKIDMNNIYHIREFGYEEFIDFLIKNKFKIKSIYGQTIPFFPTYYGKRTIDIARLFPKYAWTIVVHAIKDAKL